MPTQIYIFTISVPSSSFLECPPSFHSHLPPIVAVPREVAVRSSSYRNFYKQVPYSVSILESGHISIRFAAAKRQFENAENRIKLAVYSVHWQWLAQSFLLAKSSSLWFAIFYRRPRACAGAGELESINPHLVVSGSNNSNKSVHRCDRAFALM